MEKIYEFKCFDCNHEFNYNESVKNEGRKDEYFECPLCKSFKIKEV